MNQILNFKVLIIVFNKKNRNDFVYLRNLKLSTRVCVNFEMIIEFLSFRKNKKNIVISNK